MKPAVDKNGNGAGEAKIEVDGLWRYYGPVPALKDVSFRAYQGEIVGFLGPNGAGKSTTMKILAGFMPPSSGTARVAGFDVVEQSIKARSAIGYLPENTPLYTDMTVTGYLRYMAALRGVAFRNEAVEKVMSRVGIDHRADDLVGQLSKGLRQRVGLAQALVHDPEVIILDEPTIGLDPTQIREVQRLIRELGGEHTVILSTHILAEAEEISDRILIIRDGRIVADDALGRLADQVRHGTETVRVVLPAGLDADAVTRALAAVPRVVTVKAEGEGAYTVTAESAGAARPALAEAVVKAGWPLLELTPVQLTLKDIYLHSTTEVASMPDDDVAADAGEDTAGAPDDDDTREEV